ncbi:ArsR/SmtB family transcription factor [Symbiobacterium thermophilum]|uniref:Putative transcriptional regulator n=1 Tax=Symbiobacterium thermophilum (strain DSM 24528 / JCM 14929 / IAM 14863 / T) TaxID=292459 RepID=Q67LB4_SYMTH|nr:winged helix-turn-helix domain-containing protein [Symbiobacterium thermophilum]BAD41532.1 putative transcriptional regulator [Symbiobacterium thermophilum IAM 14863]
MLESYTIRDIRQLKALSHTVRVRILAALAEKPMTAKQLADLFGEEPAKTSYHVKQLLKVGLVELKFTRETQNGIVEKYYQAIAREFQTDPLLTTQPGGRSRLEPALVRELNQVQSDFLRAYRADREQVGADGQAGGPQDPADGSAVHHGLHRLRLNAGQREAFLRELRDLIARYEDAEGDYAFHFLAYPHPHQAGAPGPVTSARGHT